MIEVFLNTEKLMDDLLCVFWGAAAGVMYWCITPVLMTPIDWQDQLLKIVGSGITSAVGWFITRWLTKRFPKDGKPKRRRK